MLGQNSLSWVAYAFMYYAPLKGLGRTQSDEDCCRQADSMGHAGGIVCCGDRCIPCSFPPSWEKDPEVIRLKRRSNLIHEQVHVDDFKRTGRSCNASLPPYRAALFSTDSDASECHAYAAEVPSLQQAVYDCGSNEHCRGQMQTALDFTIHDFMPGFCKKAGLPTPSFPNVVSNPPNSVKRVVSAAEIAADKVFDAISPSEVYDQPQSTAAEPSIVSTITNFFPSIFQPIAAPPPSSFSPRAALPVPSLQPAVVQRPVPQQVFAQEQKPTITDKPASQPFDIGDFFGALNAGLKASRPAPQPQAAPKASRFNYVPPPAKSINPALVIGGMVLAAAAVVFIATRK